MKSVVLRCSPLHFARLQLPGSKGVVVAFLLFAASIHAGTVIFHEIAWMGSTVSEHEQWVELYNADTETVSLSGWWMATDSGSVSNALTGRLRPGQSLFIAATDEPVWAGIPVHQTLQGHLSPDGEVLRLFDHTGREVDRVDEWYAGHASTAATMQRVHPYAPGDRASSWMTSSIRYDRGYGTPGFRKPPATYGQALYQIYHDENTINVFFNQNALVEWALEGNEANHRVNLEERIIDRIRQARHRIDIALYEINLPNIVEALMDRAAEGVEVRLLIDAKHPYLEERDARYRMMRCYLERMARGHDGQPGSPDSIHIFANSPIFAVTDSAYRVRYGLPAEPGPAFPVKTLNVGRGQRTGHLLVQGAEVEPGRFYGPSGQMHNKFVLIDDYRVMTGSMNFTETGIYGTTANRLRRMPGGNSNNLIELHSPELVRHFRNEFNMMWGSENIRPNSANALFRSQKPQNQQPHLVQMGDMDVQLFFSPGYNVVEAIATFVEQEGQESLYFCIFAWSCSNLENTIKRKWEGSPLDRDGTLTGFRFKGVFERLFFNQWWSANLNMEGRSAPRVSANNPNIRWKHRPPIYRDREQRKLHHKYMLVDADTYLNPTVITGSANWSRNANEINDENTLFIHDARIANQFLQEFYARFQQAGGQLQDIQHQSYAQIPSP